MTTLFSYVVDHDHGCSPNPFGGYCTLAWCKYKRNRRGNRNIVEQAKKGDWIAGTGGVDPVTSAGHGRLIYAMRVDEKMGLADYCDDSRFESRSDAEPDPSRKDRCALISWHYFYFGRNAVRIPKRFVDYPLEKTNQGFLRNFDQDFVDDFTGWLEGRFKVGMSGWPCDAAHELGTPKCAYRIKRR